MKKSTTSPPTSPPLTRKRKHDHEHPSPRPRSPSFLRPPSISVQIPEGRRPDMIERGATGRIANPVKVWVLNGTWPAEYFRRDSRAGEIRLRYNDSIEDQEVSISYEDMNSFRIPQPIRRALTIIQRQSSSSDQEGTESTTPSYQDDRYPILLARQGSYMRESGMGISQASLRSCQALLTSVQAIPQDPRFQGDVFEAVWRRVQDRNKARIVRSISPYIFPSAEDLAIINPLKLRCLIEDVDERWAGCDPLPGPHPHPDYTVGFRRSTFTTDQLREIEDVDININIPSFHQASFRMYFPFLTCEVMSGAESLEIADRKNACSMTIAIKGLVHMFRYLKREKELHQEILGFSISHDNSSVRIYGHYPIIEESKTTYYRHPIKRFDFTNDECEDKWLAYKFTKNVYEIWMPTHLERIRSALDELVAE